MSAPGADPLADSTPRGRTRRFGAALPALRWLARGLAALALLIVLAALGLWWWAGQEGSLDWALRRATQGQPLTSEGVRGSLRRGWQIDRLVWEQDGLQVEVKGITLEWEPLALLGRTVRLDQVGVASVTVTDKRPASAEPIRLPASIGLPWRVTVDEARVDRIAYRGPVSLDAAKLRGRYAFDGLQHRLELASLQLAGGEYRGEATLGALAPMPLKLRLDGRFTAPVPGSDDKKLPLAFTARAEGPLEDFQAQAQLRLAPGAVHSVPAPSATATARITPLATMPVPRGQADVRLLDLALLWPQAPRTLLAGRVEVVPEGDQAWRLRADLRNELAGPWDQGRLPITSLKAEGDWRDGAALVRQLKAQVGQGSIEGRGGWTSAAAGWQFTGRVQSLDPAALHGAMASVPLSGPVEVSGQGEAVSFETTLRGEGPVRQAPAKPRGKPKQGDELLAVAGALEWREIMARGRWENGWLKLPALSLKTTDAELSGQVEVQIDKQAGSGKLRLRAPGLQASADGDVAETRGQGVVQIDVPQLAQARRWLARWPGMADALPAAPAAGSASGKLAWQGGWRDPAVQGRIEASGVVLAQAPAAAPGAAEVPPWVLRNLVATVDGRLRDARLDVQGRAERGQRQVDLRAAGRLGGTGATWRGELASLEAQARDPAVTPGPWTLSLRRPVTWSVAGPCIEVAAGEAVLRAPAVRGAAAAAEALLAWGPVQRQGGELRTTGRLSGLPMAWMELLGGPQLAGSALSGDLVFDAEWNAQLGAGLKVEASLARVRGDVTVLAESSDGAATRVPAGVKDARLTLRSDGDQLVLTLLWDSERAGTAQGQVSTRLVRADGGWRWPDDAPLAGNVKAQLPRLGVWSVLAPPGWRLRGSLVADVTVAGNRAQPQFQGSLHADDLALRSVVDGIELRNGRLRARLDGQKLIVSEFLLRGADDAGAGGGTLLAFGEGSWTPQGLQLQADAQLTQLRASIRDDRALTVSGPLQARVDRSGTAITGKLVFDRARIRIPDETAPRLGDDIVVRNAPGVPATEAERRLRPAPTGAGRTVTLAVSVDMGPDFRVAGRGIDTRLAGTLQMEGRSLGLPRLTGTIRTVGGKYEGYGQRMDIERGDLRFTGPADNPALDILAIRPNLSERVGVLISGRAQAPHVELYSDSGLSEAETLSWLVLGRSSAGGGAETALLQRAAAALLAGRRGGSGKGIVASLGIDDFSVRPDSAGNGTVVRLGKRFADNFYAAYERSLSGAMGTLYIFYDVSKRFTIRAEAGERSGLDLIFTFTSGEAKK